jgi:hypothetical protein
MSRFLNKDFDQLLIIKKGIRPKQLVITLEYLHQDFPQGSKQHRSLQLVINELRQAETDNDFSGKTSIEHIGYESEDGEVTAMFIVYQYRMISMFYVINSKIEVFLRQY